MAFKKKQWKLNQSDQPSSLHYRFNIVRVPTERPVRIKLSAQTKLFTFSQMVAQQETARTARNSAAKTGRSNNKPPRRTAARSATSVAPVSCSVSTRKTTSNPRYPAQKLCQTLTGPNSSATHPSTMMPKMAARSRETAPPSKRSHPRPNSRPTVYSGPPSRLPRQKTECPNKRSQSLPQKMGILIRKIRRPRGRRSSTKSMRKWRWTPRRVRTRLKVRFLRRRTKPWLWRRPRCVRKRAKCSGRRCSRRDGCRAARNWAGLCRHRR